MNLLEITQGGGGNYMGGGHDMIFLFGSMWSMFQNFRIEAPHIALQIIKQLMILSCFEVVLVSNAMRRRGVVCHPYIFSTTLVIFSQPQLNDFQSMMSNSGNNKEQQFHIQFFF